MSTYHVAPIGDLIEHDTDGDGCVCGPRSEPVFRGDGSCGWLLIHHSLDGRERSRALAPPARGPRNRGPLL